MPEAVELPAAVPVMPLPGVLLFPNALLPLHIFEPRFRQMLARALDDDRMLCVALIKPEREQWRTSADFCPISTVGLIRACVGRSDGTSDLILQGIRRVKFSDFEQETPFPIARIKPLKTRANQTVVIYMGLSQAAPIAARLMGAGRDGATPALIVENASRADERRITTTLNGLAEAAAGLSGPALLIVGEAMALAQAGSAATVETLLAEARA